MAHVFNPEGRSRLDAPERDEWQQPDRLVEALGIRPGSAAADIGTGTGYFALRRAAARKVGLTPAANNEPLEGLLPYQYVLLLSSA